MKMPLVCNTPDRYQESVRSVLEEMDSVIAKLKSMSSVDSTRDSMLLKAYSGTNVRSAVNKRSKAAYLTTSAFNQISMVIYDFLTEGTDPAIFNVPRENYIFDINGECTWGNLTMAVVSVNTRHKQRSIEVLFSDRGIPYTYVTTIEDLGLLKYQSLNDTVLSTNIDNSGKCAKIEFVVGSESEYVMALRAADGDDTPYSKIVYTHDISNMCPGTRRYMDDVAKAATVMSILNASYRQEQIPNVLSCMSNNLSSNRMASHDEKMDILREHWDVTPGFFKYHGMEVELPKVRAK